MMMTLGNYRFELNTAAYSSSRRSTQYRWSEQQRVQSDTAYQFVGPGSDTLRLQGTIYPHFTGGLGQVDAMRAEAAKGEALLMVTGRGDVLGHWLINTIDEKSSTFFDDGSPRRIDFSLTLGKDKASSDVLLTDLSFLAPGPSNEGLA